MLSEKDTELDIDYNPVVNLSVFISLKYFRFAKKRHKKTVLIDTNMHTSF